MSNRIKQATADNLAVLKTPEGLATIELLKQAGWLETDASSLRTFFAAEPDQPAKNALADVMLNGGKLAVIQASVLIGFTALAIIMTAMHRSMSPLVFTLWGALGVCFGLLTANYPGRFEKKLK